MSAPFWQVADELAVSTEIVIDRPQGTPHPRYPQAVYPLDYGYLAGTMSADGEGIDVWLGRSGSRRVTGILCSLDLIKRDSEVKLLLGCTAEEMQTILAFQNQFSSMQALLLKREEPVPLRAHHLMCLAYFRGEGYSPEFTAHMAALLRLLEQENPGVELVAGTDRICLRCPNNEAGVCVAAEKVARYDRQILTRCGLAEGEVLPYSALREIVDAAILRPGKREEICGSCQWNALCREA